MTEHKATAVIKSTGEVVEMNVDTAQDVSEAYELVEQTLNAYRELKRQITDRGMELLKQENNK